MDINQRLNEAIEKQDWDLVKSITAELTPEAGTPEPKPKKKPGRPRKNPVKTGPKRKPGRPKGSKGGKASNEVKAQIAAKKEISDGKISNDRLPALESYEYNPAAGTKGFKWNNRFKDNLNEHSQDIGIALTREISERSVDRVSEYVAVRCSGCGFETRVHPTVIIRGIDSGGVNRGYKCDKCLNRND